MLRTDQLAKKFCFLMIVLGISAANGCASLAAEDSDNIVQKAIEDRTNAFCGSVLPLWFASKDGINDPEVRAAATDCYIGRSRLAVLKPGLPFIFKNAALVEVPATLLSLETGMKLDVYRALAGQSIHKLAAAR